MADRLRKTEKMIARKVYQEMWDAHKLRNQLVHEMDYHLSSDDARLALWKMKKYLITLGAFKDE
jgi:phosphatidylinositol kinase/protein kinase (PI-3  family)